ncbi:uncharacterized protein LOC144658138 [Oculina patagonica]
MRRLKDEMKTTMHTKMCIFIAVFLLLVDSTISDNSSLGTLPPLPTQPPPPVPPTLPNLTPPAVSPTFTQYDLVVQYKDKKISTFDLLTRLNMTSAPFDVRNICPSLEYSCESVCPLTKDNKERVYLKNCYCDKLCVELGDCCYDYFLRCAATNPPKPRQVKQACVKTGNSGDHGYSMIGSCPSRNTDKNMESLCTAKSSTADLFGMLPVSDLEDKTVYKNLFCARCNQARNQTYWKFSAKCKGISAVEIPKNRSLMLGFIMAKCEWTFKPPRDQSIHQKRCLTINQNCPDSELVKKEPLLPDLCSFYAFPVCNNFQTKNPHCEICKGIDISTYSCDCPSPDPPTLGSAPSLDILFDFSSSSHTVKVGNQETVAKNKMCASGFVFDPFAEKCIQIHVDIPKKELENGTDINCSFVEMNISSVTLLPNGSIWIPLHKRTYSNDSYIINGSSLFLCMDLKRVYTETETFVSRKITPRQIITYIGCTISMISLILLLGIYIAVAELRTLPGKNLISLSCAMLLYHIFFLLTSQTDRPNLCMTVSVLLHYFLLSSFCWMGIMAFDVAKTFGWKEQAARSRSGDSTKALIKYSIFAWTTPAVIVITSVTLDRTDTVNIGYAEVFCWIANGKALLLVLGVPVALILIFNFVALSCTMVSIWKVQKTTRRLADQSNQTNLPILYIKLSSALGFTWILGFIVPFAQVEFLGYLFVILNSLQGFFIFLAFVANRRTINKVKGGLQSRFSRSTDATRSQSRETHSSKLMTSAM